MKLTRRQPRFKLARAQCEYAMTLAERGAHYSAQDELRKAFLLVARENDLQHRDGRHESALVAAFAAMKESADFAEADLSRGCQSVTCLASRHTTPLKSWGELGSAQSAAQMYLRFAEDQFVFAAANRPVAAELLYGLGRVTHAMASVPANRHGLGKAASIVLYRAATRVDEKHVFAANELAVLLGRFGHIREARDVLTRSLSKKTPRQAWVNLAKIHQKIGEHDLAENAIHESTRAPSAASSALQWISPDAFAGHHDNLNAIPPKTATGRTPGRTVAYNRANSSAAPAIEPGKKPKRNWIHKLIAGRDNVKK